MSNLLRSRGMGRAGMPDYQIGPHSRVIGSLPGQYVDVPKVGQPQAFAAPRR